MAAKYSTYGSQFEQPAPSYPPSNYAPGSVGYDFRAPPATAFTPNKEDDGFGRQAVARDLSRTPSPTPSELKELKTGAIDWKALMNWRFWVRKEWICTLLLLFTLFLSMLKLLVLALVGWYVAAVIVTAVTVLVTIFHKEIVGWLTPATRWLHE